jgi:hypothetical protein
MKKILFISAFLLALSVVQSNSIKANSRDNGRTGISQHMRLFSGMEKGYLKKDPKTIEGEKKILRYEREHRIGKVYRLNSEELERLR